MTTIVFIPGVLNTQNIFNNLINVIGNKVSVYHADTFHFDNLTNMANDILENVNGDIIAVGLSMGGYCALELLNQAPNRVKGLVLFNTGARKPTEKNIEERLKKIEMSKKGRFIGVSKPIIDSILGDEQRNNQELRDLLAKMAVECGLDVFIRQQQAIISRTDHLEMLKDTNIPIACIAGDGDLITPPHLLQEISATSPNSKYHEIKGCGHMSPIEFPKETQKIFKDWLKLNFSIDL
ncbi:MAG: alpha/beta fold hydrolase [Alphaproteobacteria bacterium]